MRKLRFEDPGTRQKLRVQELAPLTSQPESGPYCPQYEPPRLVAHDWLTMRGPAWSRHRRHDFSVAGGMTVLHSHPVNLQIMGLFPPFLFACPGVGGALYGEPSQLAEPRLDSDRVRWARSSMKASISEAKCAGSSQYEACPAPGNTTSRDPAILSTSVS